MSGLVLMENAGRGVAELTGDALANYKILQSLKHPVSVLSNGATSEVFGQLSEGDWIVDALLGTGATGNPRPPMDDVIHRMNHERQRSNCRMLAIDLPSGWDAALAYTASLHPCRRLTIGPIIALSY